MGFKDLILLKEKDNQILLIFVVWMIVAHVLEYFLKISTVYVIIPLLCCTSTLLVISYVQKKDLSHFSWKQYIRIFLLSNFFGIVPYFLYLLNLINAVIFIIVFLIIALITLLTSKRAAMTIGFLSSAGLLNVSSGFDSF